MFNGFFFHKYNKLVKMFKVIFFIFCDLFFLFNFLMKMCLQLGLNNVKVYYVIKRMVLGWGTLHDSSISKLSMGRFVQNI